jgi:hypothetical protein
MLVAVLALPAVADEPGPVTKTASVTVTGYKSVTITDTAPEGLQFGSLIPGTVKEPEAGTPSITIAAAAENNGTVAVSIKGTDFSDGSTNSFGIENAFWNTSNTPGTATAMDTDYASVTTLNAGQSVNIYHWLSIPNEQAAVAYESTFTYLTE